MTHGWPSGAALSPPLSPLSLFPRCQVLFAQLYAEAGWLLPTLCLLLLMVICGIGGLMLVECMAMMPRNGRFQRRVEYTTVMKHFCSHRWYVVLGVFYQLSLTVTNLSLIVQSVQVMDFTIVAIAEKSCTFPEFSPNPGFRCPDFVPGGITPFDTSIYCVPLGLYFTALFVLPLSYLNLDDNIWVQKAAFYSLVVILFLWVAVLGQQGPSGSNVPLIGDTLTGVLGTSLFNFAFVTSVPSWINEKKEGVSVVRVLCTVLPLAVCIFIVMGWLGGAAFSDWSGSQTLLDRLRTTGTAGEISFYAFPIIVNLTSIPVLSIFQRYNLIKEKVCGKHTANFLAILLPWLIAIPLYNGKGYQLLANWGGVLVTSVVNFVAPIIVYIIAVRRSERERLEAAANPTSQQRASASSASSTSLSVSVTPPSEDGSVQETATGNTDGTVVESAEAAAVKPDKLKKKLSISGTVAWLKGISGSGRPLPDQDDGLPSGLQPSPLHHFQGSFSTASTAKESELSAPSHSPSQPLTSPTPRTLSAEVDESKLSSSPQLRAQALRWATEEDRHRAALAAAAIKGEPLARDAIQPAAGSLRLARPSSSGTVTATSSRQNLLAGITSSFTSRSPKPDADAEVEMTATPTSSFERPRSPRERKDTGGADDTFDADEIAVEEVGVEDDESQDEDDERKDRVASPTGSSRLSSSAHRQLSLPAIDEGKREHSASVREGSLSMGDVAEGPEAGEEIASESVAAGGVNGPAESGEVWHVVKDEWLKYRVHVAYAALAVMVTLCLLALEEQIRGQVEG